VSTRPDELTPGTGARSPRGSSLTRRWHGVPVWAWVLGGTVAGYLLWTRVLHKPAATAPTAAAATSGTAAAPTTPISATYPTGASYSGPGASGIPSGFPGSSGTPISTVPAGGSGTGTGTGAGTGTGTGTTPPPTGPPPTAGTYQRAPTGAVRAYTGQVYSPVSTWAQTLALLGKGTKIYLWTTLNGTPFEVSSATQLKAIEHTGTHAFPQYTTYSLTTAPKATTTQKTALVKSSRRQLPSAMAPAPTKKVA